MYHVNAQGVDECMINVHYYYLVWDLLNRIGHGGSRDRQ